jgi:hypothetical protein
MFEKFVNGEESVDDEASGTARLLQIMERPETLTVVVQSNHDDHGSRWLDEANFRHDLKNAEYFLEAQLERVRTIRRGESWSFLKWAMLRAGCPQTVRFLNPDESFVLCKGSHPVQCGLHGHLGPNGSRGSTANLSRLGSRVNKGHSHEAAIRDGVYSAGTLALVQHYNFGPTTWSLSSILTYANGKRAIVMERAGKLWA